MLPTEEKDGTPIDLGWMQNVKKFSRRFNNDKI